MALNVEWFGEYGGRDCPVPALQGARVVARSRTTITESGTLELPGGPVAVHRKVYRYDGVGALLSGMFRTTFAARSRARREVEALLRLGALGLAPQPVVLLERRTAGFLREAVLAVRTVEGGRSLAGAEPSPDLAAAVGRAAGTIHAAGLGDISLAPRNLVVAPGGVFKVDSGRMREAARGGSIQAADLADLIAGLEGAWSDGELDALRASYAKASGALPAGLGAEMAAARERGSRRRPRTGITPPPA